MTRPSPLSSLTYAVNLTDSRNAKMLAIEELLEMSGREDLYPPMALSAFSTLFASYQASVAKPTEVESEPQ